MRLIGDVTQTINMRQEIPHMRCKTGNLKQTLNVRHEA